MMHVFLSILNVLRDTALWLLVILVLAGAVPMLAASYQYLLVPVHFREPLRPCAAVFPAHRHRDPGLERGRGHRRLASTG